MDAIMVTRQNFDYVMEYVVKDALWAADLDNIVSTNAANGEWTYVYTMVRGTGDRAKTFYYHTTQSNFDAIFEFVSASSPFLVCPIVRK